MNNALAVWLCKNRWLNRSLKRWNNTQGWVDDPVGVRIYIDTQDISGPSFQTARRGFSKYELANRLFLNNYLQEDDSVFLDVGANIGHFSIEAKLNNPNCRVHAFEPFPILADCLEKTNAENKLGIEVHRIALSDKSSEATLFVNEVNMGNNSLQPSQVHEESKGTIKEIVKTEPLDKYLDLDRIDAMKIDVEGNEYETVKGALGTIKKHKPALLIECRNELLSGDRSIIDLLNGLGYCVTTPDSDSSYNISEMHELVNQRVNMGEDHTDYAFLQPNHINS